MGRPVDGPALSGPGRACTSPGLLFLDHRSSGGHPRDFSVRGLPTDSHGTFVSSRWGSSRRVLCRIPLSTRCGGFGAVRGCRKAHGPGVEISVRLWSRKRIIAFCEDRGATKAGRMRPPSGQHLVGAREIMSNREDPRTRDLRRSPSRRRTPTAGTPTASMKLRLSAAALIHPRSAWKKNAANYHLRGKATYPRGGMSLCHSPHSYLPCPIPRPKPSPPPPA